MKDALGQEITAGCVVAHATSEKLQICIVREVVAEKGIHAHQLLIRMPRAEGDVIQNILLYQWLDNPDQLLIAKVTEAELYEQYRPFFMSWKEWRGYL